MSAITLNIKYLRKRAGFSRLDVAKLLDISVEEYTDYEENRRIPSMDIIVQLSHICHTTCDELLGRESFDMMAAERNFRKIIEEISEADDEYSFDTSFYDNE